MHKVLLFKNGWLLCAFYSSPRLITCFYIPKGKAKKILGKVHTLFYTLGHSNSTYSSIFNNWKFMKATCLKNIFLHRTVSENMAIPKILKELVSCWLSDLTLLLLWQQRILMKVFLYIILTKELTKFP